MHQMMIFIIGVINVMIILHLSPHNYSTSNQEKEHFKAQKVQGNDGIGNGVGGRRGIFDWEGDVDTHYLHNIYTISTQCTLSAHSLHILDTFKS